jgi:holliday junction DNA helicase RuvA
MPVARLRGIVEEKGADWAIIGTGGIGLVASMPATAADELVIGKPTALFTHLHVREDALTLFGFVTRDDLLLFEQLTSVSGVGPRVALGLLSTLDYAQLTLAIAGGRTDVLREVPGIGQKTAERLVLELREKVKPPAAGSDADGARRATRKQGDAEVVAALTSLGYSLSEASQAAERLPEDADAPLEDRVRMALGFLVRT